VTRKGYTWASYVLLVLLMTFGTVVRPLLIAGKGLGDCGMQERLHAMTSVLLEKAREIIYIAIPSGVMMAVITVAIFSLTVPGNGNASSQPGSDRMAKGKQIYIKHCAGCHGPEGRGDGYKLLGADPANLTSESIRKQSDATLLKSIHEGKSTMPSWNIRLSQQDVNDVLTYIRLLPK
jgi:mono/diheme cytochrome c family protein